MRRLGKQVECLHQAEPETLHPVQVPGEGGGSQADVDDRGLGARRSSASLTRSSMPALGGFTITISAGVHSRSRSSTLRCAAAAGPLASASATARRSTSTLSPWPPSRPAVQSSHRCPRRDPTPGGPSRPQAAPGRRRAPAPTRDAPARTRSPEGLPGPGHGSSRPAFGLVPDGDGDGPSSSSRRSPRATRPHLPPPGPACRPPLRSSAEYDLLHRGRKGRQLDCPPQPMSSGTAM